VAHFRDDSLWRVRSIVDLLLAQSREALCGDRRSSLDINVMLQLQPDYSLKRMAEGRLQ
jgi:archaellum biogenesis ATPase FlaH